MIEDDVKEYIVDFQKKALPDLIERNLAIKPTKKIKSVIGPRRAGKTYFLYQNMKSILSKGESKEQLLYLNFENPKLIGIDFKDVGKAVKLHWQLYPSSMTKKLHVFIDEPQNIKNWEAAVRGLHEESFDIFLSGSSSKLLSKEIATSLRGRTLSYILLPFSFKEFLKLKGETFDTDRLSSKDRAKLLSLLDEYSEFGGFPEVIEEKDKEIKLRIINEYFNLTVYKDIIDRHNIKNTNLVKWLAKSFMSSFAKEFSVHKAYLTLKSQGIKASKNTLYNYVSAFEESFFGFFVPRFSYSTRKKELSINKAYLCDVGFTKLVEISEERGRKFENIVFLELERRKGPMTEICYWKNQQQEEVDFVVKERSVRQLIQACYEINNTDTKKRELRALLKASSELKCKDLLIITNDKEGKEIIGNKMIKYIPLWKWLLN